LMPHRASRKEHDKQSLSFLITHKSVALLFLAILVLFLL
jgi:hypothetical protein